MIDLEQEHLTMHYLLSVLDISPQAVELVSLMNFLLTTDKERIDFLYQAIGMDQQEINQLVFKVRREKLRDSSLSYSDFKKHYGVNSIEAVERLLQEPISAAKYDRLRNANISPEELYFLHRQNPFARLMKLILMA